MTNQASEDELREKVYNEIKLWLSPHESLQFIDDFMPIITSFIRTEKLKLLAEIMVEWSKFGKGTSMSDGEHAFLDIINKLEAEL